jgi:formamidopyrimidine-DNA glycosylase
MPELPEVETTRRGIAPHVIGRRVRAVVVRDARLRWPVPDNLAAALAGGRIVGLDRRGKYLLFALDAGTLILHLGMSGSLRLVPAAVPAGPFDHFELVLDDGQVLRLRDPRRFGSVHWTGGDPTEHWLLAQLGPEPLDADFTSDYLYACSRGRRAPIKDVLMNGRIVAGIGNIYANEALYRAGIHPFRAAGRIGRQRLHVLVAAVRQVLEESIAQGGTTLRDFVAGDGEPGYYRLQLHVYGRGETPCPRCATPIRLARRGARATYYCPRCQR